MAPVQEKRPPKPTKMDKGWSWVILFACICIYSVTIGSVKTFGILYAELLNFFSGGAGNTAWIPALGNFLLLSMGPLSNFLSEMFSYRLVVMTGGLFLSIGYICSSFVPHMELMYFTYGIIGGIGMGLVFAPTSTIVTLYFEKRRALANGIMVSGSGLGAFCFPFLYEFLIRKLGIRGTFRVISGILITICLSALLFKQPTLRKKSDNEASDCDAVKMKPDADDESVDTKDQLMKNENPSTDHRKCEENTETRKDAQGCCRCITSKLKSSRRPKLDLTLLKDPSFTLLMISFIFASIGYPANFIIIPSHAKSINLPQQQMTLVVSLYGVGEIIGRLFFGWFSDLGIVKRKFIYAGCMFISGVAAIIVPFSYTFEAMIAYSIVCGLFAGSFWAVIAVILVDTVGIDKFANAFGLSLLCIAIAGLIGPPMMGWLEDGTGSWDASFRLAGCTMIMAGILVLLEPLLMKVCRAAIRDQKNQGSDETVENGIELSTHDKCAEQEAPFLNSSEQHAAVEVST